MAETPKCSSWLGHKFEARYSITNPALRELIARAAKIDTFYPESMQDKEYVCDICTRCGHVVERKTPAKATE